MASAFYASVIAFGTWLCDAFVRAQDVTPPFPD